MNDRLVFFAILILMIATITTETYIAQESRSFPERNIFAGSLVFSLNGDINISQTDYLDTSPGRGFLYSLEYHLQAIGNTTLGFNLYTGREFLYGRDQWKIPEKFKTDLKKIGFGMIFSLKAAPAFYPYISAGVSRVWMKTESDGIKVRRIPHGENRSFAFDGHTGFRLAFTSFLIFDFNGGLHFLPADKLDDTQIGIHNDFYITVSAGLSFSLPVGRTKDTDKDGIPDDADLCKEQPEDHDGFEDEDGCPDPDNDRDGIPDYSDPCRNEAEDKDGFRDFDGCPDPDNDNDGVPDLTDKCPDQAEDKDGFEDYDGCPETDNDKDGILDSSDNCPNEPETVNGYLDEDGCPDIKPQIKKPENGVKPGTGSQTRTNPVKPSITEKERRSVSDAETEDKPAFRQITLHGELTFTRDGAELLPEALPGLKNIARQMKLDANGRWQIAGYMDNQGDEKELLDISGKRARAVRNYLISQGVPARKLTAVAMGSRNPIDTNDKVYGRMMNRRIVITRTNK